MAQASLPNLLTIAVLFAVAGGSYYAGLTNGIRQATVVKELKEKAKEQPVAPEDEFTPSEKSWEDAGDSGSDDEADAEINKFESNMEDCKLIFVVRTDLGMTKGKIAAQCGHATLMCYKAALKNAPNLIRDWETRGQTKIALQTKDEDELITLQAIARSLGVVAKIVHDAGRTQIAAGSATVLGLGPAPRSQIDQISGHLKLL